MKQKLITISILFASLFVIAGIVYLFFFYSNISKFDNQFKTTRNEIVLKVDQTSNEINTANDSTRIDPIIKEIQILNDKLKNDIAISNTKGQQEEKVIELNNKFTIQVDEYISLTTSYSTMLLDDGQTDVFGLIDKINAKLNDINASQKEIEEYITNN